MSDMIIETHERVQTIRFNRAGKKNAITRGMYADMASALAEADANEDIRASVFLGQPECFTSGNDIMDFMTVATGGEKGTEVIDFLRAIIGGTTPLMAGVDGLAVGVGTTMLMHCDVVYATPRSWLQTPFTNLGLVPEAGSSLVAPRIMGHHRAFEMLVMGEKFSAEEAHAAGLVSKVVEPDQLDDAILGAAHKLASKPPQAISISRRLLRGERDTVMARMEEEGKLFFERLQSDEARMAFSSFMQKAS